MLLRLVLAACAAAYGAGAGLLLPRAVHRLAVPGGGPFRTHCTGGHPITGRGGGRLGGWLGRAVCPHCAERPEQPGRPGRPEPPERPGRAEPYGEAGRVPTRPAGTPVEAAAEPGRYAGPYPAREPEPRAARRRLPRAPGGYGPHPAPLAAGTAAACAALAAATGPRPELLVWLAAAPFAALLAAVDVRAHRLPDVLTLPLAAALAAGTGAAALLPGAAGSWPRALLGGTALAGCYGLLFLIHPRGMGFGDVKLALPLGIALGWYGWPELVAGGYLGFLLLALYGGALRLCGRAGRGARLPHGPFMVLGALLGLLLGGLGGLTA